MIVDEEKCQDANLLEYMFIFCLLWSLGSCLHPTARAKFEELLNIIKVNNNQKSENDNEKIDTPLSNIISIKMKDEKTILFFVGDKEKYIQNGKKITPIEFKSKTSLLDTFVKFYINKSENELEIAVTQSSSNKFYKKIDIEDNNFIKLTNEGRFYLFDNSDKVNHGLDIEILDFLVTPTNHKMDHNEYLFNYKYSLQDSCKDNENNPSCTGCKSGVFKSGYCLSDENSQILINRTAKWVKYSNAKDPQSLGIKLPASLNTINGYSFSFSMRRYVIENNSKIPVLSFYNGKNILLTVQMDDKNFIVTNELGKKSSIIALPAGKNNNKNVKKRRYFSNN